jgi:hypothetical protein
MHVTQSFHKSVILLCSTVPRNVFLEPLAKCSIQARVLRMSDLYRLLDQVLVRTESNLPHVLNHTSMKIGKVMMGFNDSA